MKTQIGFFICILLGIAIGFSIGFYPSLRDEWARQSAELSRLEDVKKIQAIEKAGHKWVEIAPVGYSGPSKSFYNLNNTSHYFGNEPLEIVKGKNGKYEIRRKK